MEEILRVALWKSLVLKIHGDIDVKYITESDRIFVQIKNKGFDYKCSTNGYCKAIAYGETTTEQFANYIVQQYKSQLLKAFIKSPSKK